MTTPTKRRRRAYPAKHRQFLDSIRHHYELLLARQGGGCAICGKRPSPKRRLDIDHDHKLMIVRGLLCFRCNRSLPSWATPEWHRAAALYLDAGDALAGLIEGDPN